jgi:hypothetical protein
LASAQGFAAVRVEGVGSQDDPLKGKEKGTSREEPHGFAVQADLAGGWNRSSLAIYRCVRSPVSLHRFLTFALHHQQIGLLWFGT